jgi:hypothetical protein
MAMGPAGLACGRAAPAAVDSEAPVAVAPPAAVVPPAPIPAAAPAPTGPAPAVLVRDPVVLAAMQADGLDLGRVGFGRAAADNAALARDPFYASMVAVLRRDLEAIARRDRHAGVGLRHLHRLFDARWLASDRAWFELVGVVNRLDRRVFAPAGAGCGETRLVYRLAHRAPAARSGGAMVTSRLPMTMNVVFWQPDDGAGCRTRAASWRTDDPAALRHGPLAPEHLALANLKSIEIDVQTERWPSTIRPDLAGHAGYVLRVFARDDVGGRMVPQPLENTPDVARLERDATARAALLAWLREPATLDAIDRGVVVTPTEHLATAATSVTPRGLARLANRPWSSLFDAAELDGLALSGRATIASPAALLRRLDMLACNGCHQSRSIAGFHLLGDEPVDPDRVDALGIGTSPHLEAELERRTRYVAAIADGTLAQDRRMPADVEGAEPPSEAGYGGHCGLGDPGLAWMGCRAPLSCTRIDDAEVGVCLPAEPGAGSPCEIGLVTTRVDARKDRVRTPETVACSDVGVCDDNRVGFPAGMCVTPCAGLGADEACGAIPQFVAFNDCLSTGRAFADCVRTSARPAGMRACDETRACRDDYICARTGAGANVCLPPYFLYQLRVDGHPP